MKPPAARSTTSSPIRHMPNAAPAMQTHTQMQEMLRLPRNLQAISKVLRLSRKTGPPAARSTTSSPFRHLRNAAPATQTHTQMQEMLRLPRNLQASSKVLRLSRKTGPPAARSTTSNPFRHMPNAAPATQTHTHTQMQKMLRLPRNLQTISKVLRLSRKTGPPAARSTTSSHFRHMRNAAPATQTHTQMQEMLRLPRKLQAISKVLRLSRKTGPPAARSTTSNPFRHMPNAAPATQTHTQMQKMLRLPRNLQAISKVLRLSCKTGPPAARSTTSSPFRHMPNAAPATQTHTQMQEILRPHRGQPGCARSSSSRTRRSWESWPAPRACSSTTLDAPSPQRSLSRASRVVSRRTAAEFEVCSLRFQCWCAPVTLLPLSDLACATRRWCRCSQA